MTIASDLAAGIAQIDQAFTAGGMMTTCQWMRWDGSTIDPLSGRPLLTGPTPLPAIVEEKLVEQIDAGGNRIASGAAAGLTLTIPRAVAVRRDDRITVPGHPERTVISVESTFSEPGRLFTVARLA